MARKVVVTVVGDFDGRSQAAETVSFAVDGVGYEIDLSQEDAARLPELVVAAAGDRSAPAVAQ
ncbi:Lsr2 dimerization domain-containing protein [Nocardia amikacinitolerans]|uniref:Lsr2 dimerization domain-containing protein n=1 Tax=Nocardia amikacinitolerans TaxID=756689 RepID=UPI000BE493C0|nr:histone-like nucleoid-structuring protein Lsr2 [Nocardia amikacinitolerans]